MNRMLREAPIGEPLAASWVPVDSPDAATDDLLDGLYLATGPRLWRPLLELRLARAIAERDDRLLRAGGLPGILLRLRWPLEGADRVAGWIVARWEQSSPFWPAPDYLVRDLIIGAFRERDAAVARELTRTVPRHGIRIEFYPPDDGDCPVVSWQHRAVAAFRRWRWKASVARRVCWPFKVPGRRRGRPLAAPEKR